MIILQILIIQILQKKIKIQCAACLIVLLNRQRLFTDQMVRMFSRMFFERNDNPDDDGQ